MADSMISPAGSSFVFTAYNSRQAYGLAKNRYFPTYFGKVSERWGVPTRALMLNFIVGLLYLVPLKGWQEIIKIASDLGIYGYITGSVSVLVFRRMGITKDNQKIKGMGILAPIGFVVGTFVAYWSGWSTLSATVGLLVVGLIIYGISCFVDKHRGFEVWSGIWVRHCSTDNDG